MANPSSSRNSKWFPNKSLMKLSLPRLRRSKKPQQTLEPPQETFREVFRRIDSDGDGHISSEELRSFLAWSGDVLSAEEAATLMRDLDAEGNGLISYEQFVRLVDGGLQNGEESGGDYEEDLRRAFEMFGGSDEEGCITPSGLQRVLGSLGERKTKEECTTMIRAYDLDGNGVLDYHEFHRMMG